MKYFKAIVVPSKLIASLIFLLSFHCSAQMPDTDIWLFDINIKEDPMSLSNPVNITSRKGYDNQPYFDEKKSLLYYSSDVNGQTDIFSYDLKTKQNKRVTQTTTSEYSPSVRGKDLIVLMVEKDSAQRVWQNPHKRRAKRITNNKGEQIGYYAFTGKDSLAAFILGDPHFLKIIDLRSNMEFILTDSIGRGIKEIPGSKTFSYTRVRGDKISLYRFDRSTGKGIFLTDLPSDDYAWLDEETLISSDGKSFKIKKTGDKVWSHLQVTERIALNGITRIAYSPELRKIAVVMKE